MHSSLRVATAPKTEPIVLSVMRQHLRVDANDEDTLIQGYATVAREWAESWLNRALVTQQLVFTLKRQSPEPDWWHGRWPYAHRRATLELPRPPVQSVQSVVFRDDVGADVTIDPANWLLDQELEPARLRIDWAAVSAAQVLAGAPIQWPLQHLQVSFTAGYGDAGDAVPGVIKQGIMLLTGFLYEHRGDAGGDMPDAASRLLWMHRVMSFGD